MMLDGEVDMKVSKKIKDKIAVENVTTFYQFAKVYKSTSLAKLAFSLIERCFAVVAVTQNFLQLDYKVVARILDSSELNIHSELEVINSANNWLSYDIKNRSKFAKRLLLTVRLPLLSDSAIKSLSSNSLIITESNECVCILNQTLVRKDQFFPNKSSKYYKRRYCNQKKFNILIGGGDDERDISISNVTQIDGSKLDNVKVLPSLLEQPNISEVVSLKNELYVIGRRYYSTGIIGYVENYSFSTKEWIKVAGMCDYRLNYCVCAFMNNIFVIGGSRCQDVTYITINTCFKFDTKNNEWKEVAGMNEARGNASCAVFQGNIFK